MATSAISIDALEAKEWIYPSNVPLRRYQQSIVRTALFNNTLVCLPTGSGKTLIAAVVMVNYYNWFPEGKIVFLAPTKPLVDQQREACLHQVSMKLFDTAEMTSKQKPEMRRNLWQTKRVFFCTPQIFENDLLKGAMSPMEFVCVVVDECHKSVGNYATVKAVQFLRANGVQFRVLGLSATPGRTKKAIQDMINNLMISTVEFRDQNDPEILEHTHDKSIETLIVHPQPEMTACYQLLYATLREVIAPLLQNGVFHINNPESVTRYGLLSALQEFKPRSRQYRNGGRLSTIFNHGIFLTSLSENLDCGLRLALDFINASLQEKAWLREVPNKHPTFNQLKNRLQKLIDSHYEHPKIQKLTELLKSHFESAPPGSRVIVFTSLKDTVVDIVNTLDQHKDVITAKWFIGQGSGSSSGRHKMTQNAQKRVLQDFRQGQFNTLVATCIAEEGLDIPEVQLIVCFDGAASPLRDTQRMGRTGRHETGRVVYLLNQGKEQRKFDKNNNETGYVKALLARAIYHFELYEPNPMMIPRHFKPEMKMIHMQTTDPKEFLSASKKREGASLKSSGKKQTRLDAFISKTSTQKTEKAPAATSELVEVDLTKDEDLKERKSETAGTAAIIYSQTANAVIVLDDAESPPPQFKGLQSGMAPPFKTPQKADLQSPVRKSGHPFVQEAEGHASSKRPCVVPPEISDITRAVFLAGGSKKQKTERKASNNESSLNSENPSHV